jgi:hypothetical protein
MQATHCSQWFRNVGLPLMNAFDDYDTKKKETIALIDRLYEEIG